jgi:DNA-binding response OmpR family regulator
VARILIVDDEEKIRFVVREYADSPVMRFSRPPTAARHLKFAKKKKSISSSWIS